MSLAVNSLTIYCAHYLIVFQLSQEIWFAFLKTRCTCFLFLPYEMHLSSVSSLRGTLVSCLFLYAISANSLTDFYCDEKDVGFISAMPRTECFIKSVIWAKENPSSSENCFSPYKIKNEGYNRKWFYTFQFTLYAFPVNRKQLLITFISFLFGIYAIYIGLIRDTSVYGYESRHQSAHSVRNVLLAYGTSHFWTSLFSYENLKTTKKSYIFVSQCFFFFFYQSWTENSGISPEKLNCITCEDTEKY